jgi:hypothetical protein
LGLIDKYTKKQGIYTPLDTLYNELAQNSLMQLIQKSSFLCEVCAERMSAYVIEFQDWKIVRLAQCVFGLLNKRITAHDQLSSFMYNTPTNKFESQKNMAWCVSLASIKLLLSSINTLVQWCYHSSEVWDSKVKTVTKKNK